MLSMTVNGIETMLSLTVNGIETILSMTACGECLNKLRAMPKCEHESIYFKKEKTTPVGVIQEKARG